MKRFLLAICVALLSAGAFAQDYYYTEEPEGGDWGVGFGFNLGFGAGVTNFGIHVPRLQYYFASRVRAEAAFNYYFKAKETTDWNVDIDVHPYIIPMKYGMHIYPVVGLALWHRHVNIVDENFFRVGANIGAGFQYDITENIYANLQYKYMITNDFGHSVLNLGITYRF
ncbi:MAG: porin family protein [Bacteroidaceae bacterium]|nr:porin family protein [Bacteroidaceae bacterium]